MLQSHHHIKLQIQLKIILLQQKVDQIELELGPRVSGRDCVALGGEEKDGTEKEGIFSTDRRTTTTGTKSIL